MSSPFASLVVSDPIPLPFDEGQWVQVRALTGRQYEAAQVFHRSNFVANDKWAGFFRDAIEHGPTSAQARLLLDDPLTGYDRYALVRSGLTAWSYDKPIKRIEGKPAVEASDKTPAQPAIDPIDAIEDLNDDAIEFIAREVLKLTKPSLFVTTEDEAEAALVKG